MILRTYRIKIDPSKQSLYEEFERGEGIQMMRGMDATENSVEPLVSLRLTGGGLCPPHLSPRAGAFGPRDPLTARASRSQVAVPA